MAGAYLNLPKKLFEKLQKLQVSAPNIASRVLGVGVGAAYERMQQEFPKAANKGYGSGYTFEKIIMRQTVNSTADHPEMFIGTVDATAASRMKWIEGGRIRHKGYPKGHFEPGQRIQEPRPFMGKVRKYIRSRECKKLMEERFKKIIDSM
jgi:hypothetical protein